MDLRALAVVRARIGAMSGHSLGFVLGMTVTFGAVLPAVVGLVFAGTSAVLRVALAKLFTLVKTASMRS